MVSKRAAEYLAADLQSAIHELQALDNGIREMEAKREAVRIKLDLLKKAIGPDFQMEFPVSKEPQVSLSDIGAPPTADLPVTESANGGGFRTAIRGVLAESARGMRPRDVHAALVKRGVPFTGKVEPITRTYNELWRMAKNGQVRKRASLYYAALPNGAVQ